MVTQFNLLLWGQTHWEGKVAPVAVRGQVTAILARASAGDATATSELLPLVYEELRRLAAGYLAHERTNHTLQPTALVHEAYMRLVGTQRPWKGRSHFLAAASVAMRRVLVDHARHHQAAKRSSDAAQIT